MDGVAEKYKEAVDAQNEKDEVQKQFEIFCNQVKNMAGEQLGNKVSLYEMV